MALIAEYASTVSDLLEQCTERYRDFAENADRHEADAEMMRDAWPIENGVVLQTASDN
jgi:hypothetical protein